MLYPKIDRQQQQRGSTHRWRRSARIDASRDRLNFQLFSEILYPGKHEEGVVMKVVT